MSFDNVRPTSLVESAPPPPRQLSSQMAMSYPVLPYARIAELPHKLLAASSVGFALLLDIGPESVPLPHVFIFSCLECFSKSPPHQAQRLSAVCVTVSEVLAPVFCILVFVLGLSTLAQSSSLHSRETPATWSCRPAASIGHAPCCMPIRYTD